MLYLLGFAPCILFLYSRGIWRCSLIKQGHDKTREGACRSNACETPVVRRGSKGFEGVRRRPKAVRSGHVGKDELAGGDIILRSSVGLAAAWRDGREAEERRRPEKTVVLHDQSSLQCCQSVMEGYLILRTGGAGGFSLTKC